MLTLAALLETKADSGIDAHPGGRSGGNTGFARGEPPVARP